MQNHGRRIKSYVVDDPLNYLTEDQYEAKELSPGFEDYNMINNPFIKTLKARKQQVQDQLDAIAEGTIPRNGEYGENEICPDWRDSNGDDYISSDTFVRLSNDTCPAICEYANQCFVHSPWTCIANGTIMLPMCDSVTPLCNSCFPYSRCGTLDDSSAQFVENNDTCAPDMEYFTDCKMMASTCFDHRSGECSFDGKMLSNECAKALPCRGCYPHSRCARVDEGDEDKKGDGSNTTSLSENTSISYQKEISRLLIFVFGFVSILL